MVLDGKADDLPSPEFWRILVEGGSYQRMLFKDSSSIRTLVESELSIPSNV